jgi:hypothetical protein
MDIHLGIGLGRTRDAEDISASPKFPAAAIRHFIEFESCPNFGSSRGVVGILLPARVLNTL